MTCPTPPHAGNTRGLGGVLPEIIAQTKGDLPFPNVLVEYLEDTYEVSFLREESISDLGKSQSRVPGVYFAFPLSA